MTRSDESMKMRENVGTGPSEGAGRPPGPVPDVPSRAAVDMLRKALRSPPRGAIFGSAVKVAIRMICVDARRAGLPVERVLIRLKEAWRTLPEVQPEPWGYRNNALLERIISACIQEYYAGSDGQRQ